MRKIRKNVFETNSSSMHSLSIKADGQLEPPNILPTIHGSIYIEGGEYGWEIDQLTTQFEKLNYIATMVRVLSRYESYGDIKLAWLGEAIQEYTGYPLELEEDFSGYIDHQSQDILDEYIDVHDREEFKKNMIKLIFSSKYEILTDNDNY